MVIEKPVSLLSVRQAERVAEKEMCHGTARPALVKCAKSSAEFGTKRSEC